MLCLLAFTLHYADWHRMLPYREEVMPEDEAGARQPGQNVLSAGTPGAPIDQNPVKVAHIEPLYCISVVAELLSCTWPA